MRIGIECGGTFTDLVVLDDSGAILATDKVFSTPADPAQAVVTALRELPDELVEGAELLHGSTVATNALLERKGGPIGLLVTRGFRDVVFLQRQDRRTMYDLKYRKPEPLVGRREIREVEERVDASGTVVRALDEDSVRTAVAALLESGVAAIAVSLLHSYTAPEHEQRVRALIAEMAPDLPVSVSSEVIREFREFERTTTTTVDAFIRGRVTEYIRNLEDAVGTLGVRSLQVMQSNGGIVPPAAVIARPVTMLLSGPAAGVSGAITAAGNAGFDGIVTMDMGGTSTDVAFVSGPRPTIATETAVDGLPVRVPLVDINTVGAGGGSIIAVDRGGLLTVGPESAGADPGPACYGRGGRRPTVTDANLVRGSIRAETKLAGRFALDREAAVAALAPIAERLDSTVEAVAEEAVRLANVAMANAIRVVSVEQGHELDGTTLLAYGGAGPLHAAAVADELGMRRVLIPPYSGLTSAYGLLTAGFRREFSRTWLVSDATDTTAADLRTVMAEMAKDAAEELAGQGVDAQGADHLWAADLRYRGQGFELPVPFDADGPLGPESLIADFHTAHARRFGHSDPGRTVQIVALRLTVEDRRPDLPLPHVIPSSDASGHTRLVEHGRAVTARFLHRDGIAPETAFDGPAVIEDASSTVLVPSGWRARVDVHTNLLLEKD
ncbi:N-methylhydantoinase A [Spinactinospora alkalitolerans]|uniref:N-methylhydantoinase A n=1 Tax=Spinactinospora alkalitolerans TaxID=687207 RepID=A0A852U5S5_9ACTN|nr:hydantoinase/oxoprolinase family protein [Spinactinospora alkalitolerans]NYE50223.1 N-methylhydantoinase A [Spinactinospora alkalitolerans]